jgi:hypothetical protein
MKRIFLLLLALILLSAFALAEPRSVVLTPSNWQDVNNKIQPGYIKANGGAFSSGTSFTIVQITYGSSSCSSLQAKIYAYLVFIPSTTQVNLTYTASGTPAPRIVATLPRGFYIISGWKDTAQYDYLYIYNIDGLVAYAYNQYANGGSGVTAKFSTTVYYVNLYPNGFSYTSCTTDTRFSKFILNVLNDWKGQKGGNSTWVLFNVTGNNPIYYDVRDGANTVTFSYAGGSPIYMFYFSTSPSSGGKVNVTGSGVNQLFGSGAYLIQGSNWFYANYSTTPNSPPSNGTASTNMATLTVTVKPSTYTIRFLLQGALVKQANGTLSYQFPKNTTVTIQVYNGNTQVYSIDYKLTQDTSLYFNFGNDNSLWNPNQQGSLTLQFYEADPQTGYLRGQIIIDNVQVIGLNQSVTRTASGVSQITFNNLPFGHYQIIAQKNGYFETRVWIFFNQSQRTIRIGLLKKVNGESIGTDKPLSPSDFVGTDNFNGTNVNALAQARNQTPPTPSLSGNFYGFHFIVTDSSGNLVNNAQVQVLAVKSINKVLWQDTATYPLAIVNVVNGSAYWYITEEDLNKALQYAGFWESFGGFKIVSGSNSMFVPAEFARNRFYEMRIVQNQNIFGNVDVNYQGNLFGSAQTAQLVGLLFPIMIIGLIAGILKESFKKK